MVKSDFVCEDDAAVSVWDQADPHKLVHMRLRGGAPTIFIKTLEKIVKESSVAGEADAYARWRTPKMGQLADATGFAVQ